jgi:hypothetical protein
VTAVTALPDDALLTCHPAPGAWVRPALGLLVSLGAGVYLFTMMGRIDGGLCNGERMEGLMICPYVWSALYAGLGAVFVIGTPIALTSLLSHIRRAPSLVATPRDLSVGGHDAAPWARIHRIRQVRGTFGPRLGLDLPGTGRDRALTFPAALFDMPLDELCHTLRALQEEHA